jgi:hypothetical protein
MLRRDFLQLTSAAALLGLAGCRNEGTLKADLVIIGAGTGGGGAARAAATRGLQVIMTDEMPIPGGQLTSQGVPPDEHPWIETHGAPASYRDFRHRVRRMYARAWDVEADGLNPGACGVSRICHAPSVATSVLTEMLNEHGDRIRFLPRTLAVAAGMNRDRIETLQIRSLENGNTQWLEAPLFIDATERGDLLPLTGTEYVTGSEGQAAHGEPHATPEADPTNEQAFTWCAAIGFDAGFDPQGKRTPGGVSAALLEPPPDYAYWQSYLPQLDPPWTGPLLDLSYSNPITLEPRRLDFDPRPGAQTEQLNLWTYRRLHPADRSWPHQTGVTLLNWPQNDYLNGRLIDVDDAERERHELAARNLTRSLIHWLRTEVERPDGGRGWPGLFPKPDILGTPHGLAMAPYIRESRRIRARTTVHELHVGEEARRNAGLDTAEHFPDSVGTGYYRIDLHPSTSGDNYIDVAALPFEIPLGALLPVRVENLIASAKNIGTTHITNGCYRLHPVEWSIGEAAGSLAARCIQRRESTHAIHSSISETTVLQEDLERGGAHLRWS